MATTGLRIVLFGDTHLGFDYPLKPRVEKRRRGPDFFTNYQAVLDYATRTRPDLVVHGGDFFFRSRVPRLIVDTAYEALSGFAESGIPIFIVPGNHERSRLPRSLLLEAPGIHVFDRPRTYRIQAAGATVDVSGFPFARGDIRGRFGAVLAETGWEEDPADVRLLCLHQAVEGAQVGPSDYTFRYGPGVIRRSDIPSGLTAVLAGHIHRRQVLAGPRDGGGVPIFYPGSIDRTSFVERDEPKGFCDISFAPDEAGKWSVSDMTFIQLSTRPMVDLYLDPSLEASGLSQYLRDRIAALDPDSVVRLRSVTPPDDSTLTSLTAAFLRSISPKSMSIQIGRELWRIEERGSAYAEE
jgi:DNA repair exonuclease SbcCD nuclease subunit